MDSSGTAPLVVAAFDVDGTLTTRDCVVPYLRRLAGRRKLLGSALRHPLLLAGMPLGLGDRDRLKESVVGRLTRGRPRAELDELGVSFASGVVARWLRTDTLGRLAWHRDQGHSVVLVSASLRPYLEPLARDVLGGVSAVLATDVEVDGEGICTGRLAGGNCRGPEKARRLTEWLAGRGHIEWAYGDSKGDREMLAMAANPVRVGSVSLATVPDEAEAA